MTLNRAEMRTLVAQASEAAYKYIVDCVTVLAEAKGLFGALTVNPNRDSFTVDIRHKTAGSSEWQLYNVGATPAGAPITCVGGENTLSQAVPKVIKEASYILNCTKRASDTILVTVNTSQGPLKYELRSFDDKLQTLLDGMTGLEGENRTLSERLKKLSERTAIEIDYDDCSYFTNSSNDRNLGAPLKALGTWNGSGMTSGTDIASDEQCPEKMVLVGLAGGRGHSGTYNEPHGLKCCKLKVSQ
jgi:hypothetical protein